MVTINTLSSSNSPSIIILTRNSLPSPTSQKRKQFLFHQHHTSLRLFYPISCSNSSSNNNNNNDDEAIADSVIQAPTSSDAVGVRFRRRSRRQSKQQQQQRENNGAAVVSKVLEKSTTPKKWEEMNLTEKVLELYMGEKGALFWLNKFAYASIFIIIGAWILFRFVGPALNLYQLDSPPLNPSEVFKGSS